MAELYWQVSKEFADTNLHMLNNEILCDVAFLVGNNNDNNACKVKDLTFPPLVYKKLIEEGVKSGKNSTPKKFLAHRCILVSRSPVFERMFVTDMTESKKGVDDPITVVDIDQDTFKEMLQYIYGNTANICNENVFCLWYAARKYILEGLEKLCIEYLLCNLSDGIVFTTLEHCLFFDSKQALSLKQRCLSFISLQLMCLPEEEYILLSQHALNELISQDNLKEDELTLYLMVRRWAEPRVKKLGFAVTLVCKTCNSEYSVPSTDLSDSTLKKFIKLEQANETDETSCIDSTNIAESYDSFPLHLFKPTVPCTVVDDTENFILQISDRLVSVRLQMSGSDSCALDYEEQEIAKDSSRGNDIITDANNSSLAGIFNCGHISARNPEDSCYISYSKTDIAKKAAIRHILGDIIYRIRFSTIPAEEFAVILGKSSLLSAEEKNAIYYDMIRKKSGQHYLPSGSATFDYESRIDSDFLSVHRYCEMKVDDSDLEHGGMFVGTSSLLFKVTKPILLELVCFYTGSSSDSEPFRIEMSIKRNDTVLSKLDVTIRPNLETGLSTEEFCPSCYITDDIWYEIVLTVHPSRGSRYYGFGIGKSGDEKDSELKFSFTQNSGNTTNKQGQINSLTFSCL